MAFLFFLVFRSWGGQSETYRDAATQHLHEDVWR